MTPENQLGKITQAEILKRSESRMWSDFENSGAFKSSTDIGDGRETAVAAFLQQQLPSRYRVARGEVLDTGGKQSGQTDILVYDASNTAPLLTHGDGLVLMAAEALLATIEVKSRLTNAEMTKSLLGVKNLRSLRPFGSPWGLARTNGAPATDGLANFFSTVFAFDSDLSKSGWPKNELSRVRRCSTTTDVPNQWLDRVVVLSRGMIIPSEGRVATFPDDRNVLGLWFFNLMNFLARESARRAPFPWNHYENAGAASWQSALPALRDAPAVRKAGSVARRRYRTRS
jgi:hypothetical protein